jgi:hypothetical protein
LVNQEEGICSVEVTGPNSNDRLHKHIPKKVKPEATEKVLWERLDRLESIEDTGEKVACVEASKQGYVLAGVTGDGILEINKSHDFIWSSKDVPQGEVFVNQNPVLEIQ